jgi:hypothetical protein
MPQGAAQAYIECFIVSLRLLVITNESPFPPNRGGRVDQWSRFQLFKSRGCRLMLVGWYVKPRDTPTAAEVAALNNVFDQVHLFPMEQTLPALLHRLIMLPRYSPHIATRILSANKQATILAAARSFAPDAIWLDSLYGGVTAARVARDLKVPIFYRSHNIEFQYMRSQAAEALTLRDKFAWALACINLKPFELSVQKSSRLVFDISCDDVSFWRSLGITNNIYAPPLVTFDPLAQSASIPYASRPFDIVFLGNLFAPNNVRGLAWFVDRVLPIVRRARSAIKVRLAGSQPNVIMRKLVAHYPDISLLENPPDASQVWREGRILVNPILTGSGMNIKSVEMLSYDAHLVTTSIGVRGFTNDVRGEFRVADTPEDFAAAILEKIDTPYQVNATRMHARNVFGPAGIDSIMDAMEKALDKQPAQ